MHEHQPLAELAAGQRLADTVRATRVPAMRPPRHRHRRAMAGRLRRVADRLDG